MTDQDPIAVLGGEATARTDINCMLATSMGVWSTPMSTSSERFTAVLRLALKGLDAASQPPVNDASDAELEALLRSYADSRGYCNETREKIVALFRRRPGADARLRATAQRALQSLDLMNESPDERKGVREALRATLAASPPEEAAAGQAEPKTMSDEQLVGSLGKQLHEARLERDEARRILALYQSEADRRVDREELSDTAEAMRMERDAARAECERLRADLDTYRVSGTELAIRELEDVVSKNFPRSWIQARIAALREQPAAGAELQPTQGDPMRGIVIGGTDTRPQEVITAERKRREEEMHAAFHKAHEKPPEPSGVSEQSHPPTRGWTEDELACIAEPMRSKVRAAMNWLWNELLSKAAIIGKLRSQPADAGLRELREFCTNLAGPPREAVLSSQGEQVCDAIVAEIDRMLAAQPTQPAAGDGLREAAQEMSLAQRQMLQHWSESNLAVQNSLWKRLHEAGKALFDALTAHPPAPAAP